MVEAPSREHWEHAIYPRVRALLDEWVDLDVTHGEHEPSCAPGCVHDGVAEGIQWLLAEAPQQVANILCVAVRDLADAKRAGEDDRGTRG